MLAGAGAAVAVIAATAAITAAGVAVAGAVAGAAVAGAVHRLHAFGLLWAPGRGKTRDRDILRTILSAELDVNVAPRATSRSLCDLEPRKKPTLVWWWW